MSFSVILGRSIRMSLISAERKARSHINYGILNKRLGLTIEAVLNKLRRELLQNITRLDAQILLPCELVDGHPLLLCFLLHV